MSINPSQFTTQLENVNSTIFTPEITSGLDKAQKQYKALNMDLVGRAIPSSNEVSTTLANAIPRLSNLTSALPRPGEEVNNGIKSLSNVLNDFPSEEAGSGKLKACTTSQQNLQLELPGLQRPLGGLTADLPIPSTKLSPELNSTEQSTVSNITGSNVSKGFNNIALVLPTPQATAETVSAISAATQSVLPTVPAVSSMEISTTLSGALGNLPGDLQQFSSIFSSMNIPNLTLPNIGGLVTGALSGITDKLNINLGDIVPNITNSPVLDLLHKTVNTGLVVKNTLGITSSTPGGEALSTNIIKELTTGSVDGALNLLKSNADLQVSVTADLSGIEEKLLNLKSGYGSVGAILAGTVIDGLGLTNLIHQVSNLSTVSPVVNNLEEAFAEVISSPTIVTSVQVGWTETYKDDLVTKETIVPQNYYHYIILKDGLIQRSKKLGDDSEIKIALVGGYNVNRGESGILTDASITYSQTLALRGLLEQLVNALPGIEIYGVGQAALEANVNVNSYLEPGVDIAQLVKSINGRSPVTYNDISMPERKEELGLPTSPEVIYKSDFDNQVRNRYIQKDLMNILISAAVQSGFYITIVSGGQMSIGECKSRGGYQSGDKWYLPGESKAVRTGSIRHDNGWAADLTVYRNKERTDVINFGVNSADTDAVRFVKACRAAGIQAIGAGPGYMGSNIHVDIAYNRNGAGTATYWGKAGATANAPSWLSSIMV